MATQPMVLEGDDGTGAGALTFIGTARCGTAVPIQFHDYKVFKDPLSTSRKR